jgi:hypothetical protein
VGEGEEVKRKPPTFLVDAPTRKTFVSEAIDYEVDFTVPETATERARRRWKMEEPKDDHS